MAHRDWSRIRGYCAFVKQYYGRYNGKEIALMALSKQYGIEHRVAVNSDARITPG